MLIAAIQPRVQHCVTAAAVDKCHGNYWNVTALLEITLLAERAATALGVLPQFPAAPVLSQLWVSSFQGSCSSRNSHPSSTSSPTAAALLFLAVLMALAEVFRLPQLHKYLLELLPLVSSAAQTLMDLSWLSVLGPSPSWFAPEFFYPGRGCPEAQASLGLWQK